MHEDKIPVKNGMLISCVISVLEMYDAFELEKEHHMYATENREKEAMTFDAEFIPPQLVAPISKQAQATPAVVEQASIDNYYTRNYELERICFIRRVKNGHVP